MPTRARDQGDESDVTGRDVEGPHGKGCGPVPAHHCCTLAPGARPTLPPTPPSSLPQGLLDLPKSLHEKGDSGGDLGSRDLPTLDNAVSRRDIQCGCISSEIKVSISRWLFTRSVRGTNQLGMA